MSFNDELQNYIKDLIEIDKTIINDLSNLLKKVNDVHKDVVITQTAGFATGAVGTVTGIMGLLLAPLTAGTSLALTAIGVALAGSGGVLTMGASIRNAIRSNGFHQKIQALTKKHDELCKKLSSFAVGNIAITLWEIVHLVNDWKTQNPTVETISTLIKNLKSEQESLELLF